MAKTNACVICRRRHRVHDWMKQHEKKVCLTCLVTIKKGDFLTPRECKLVKIRLGIDDTTGHTLEEVGQEFGVTRERIRQIEARAYEKIREISVIFHQGKKKPIKKIMVDLNGIKVRWLSLSTRTANSLEKGNIDTIGKLTEKYNKGKNSLLELEGMGQKGLDEIQELLLLINIKL